MYTANKLTDLAGLIGQYRNILATDGIVSKEELIEMLKADKEISIKNYDKLADKILDNIEIRRSYKVPYSNKQTNKNRMELYEQGLNDEEMAELEKVCSTTIYYWRKAKELQPNPTKLQLVQQEKDKKRLEFYNQGLSDKEIATKCSEKASAIKGWRERNKLKCNIHKQKERVIKNKRERRDVNSFTG